MCTQYVLAITLIINIMYDHLPWVRFYYLPTLYIFFYVLSHLVTTTTCRENSFFLFIESEIKAHGRDS